MGWLDDVEARCEAATDAPWFAHHEDGYWSVINNDDGTHDHDEWWVNEGVRIADMYRKADAELATHARSDLPRLVAWAREAADLLANVGRCISPDAQEAWAGRRDALLSDIGAGMTEPDEPDMHRCECGRIVTDGYEHECPCRSAAVSDLGGEEVSGE